MSVMALINSGDLRCRADHAARVTLYTIADRRRRGEPDGVIRAGVLDAARRHFGRLDAIEGETMMAAVQAELARAGISPDAHAPSATLTPHAADTECRGR